MQQGFSRLLVEDEIVRIDDFMGEVPRLKSDGIYLMVDRIKIGPQSNEEIGRLSDSVQTAFYEGKGSCVVLSMLDGKKQSAEFSDRFEADGMTFTPPTPNLFAFNNPFGACPIPYDLMI